MNVKRILRLLIIIFLVCASLLLLFIAVSIVPVDRTVDRQHLYEQMQARIDSLPGYTHGKNGFSIGYSKVNLTPPYLTSAAGKRSAKEFESVHDSIYVRTMVIENGAERVALVSADLLIIPPEVTAVLAKQLPEIGFTLDNTYLGAIHTHSSIGNWGKGATGFLYGKYDEKIVQFIVDRIKQSIVDASKKMLPSKIRSAAIPIKGSVRNRLIDNGPVDSLLRVVEVHRSDSSKLLLMSFTAHATCLPSRDFVLSRDYPGKLVDVMEETGYTFAMFMAGSVGSHTGKVSEKGWTCVDELTEKISTGFLEGRHLLIPVEDSVLQMNRVALLLSEPQVKLLPNWRIRPWLFYLAFGDYPEFLTVLRLGNIVMVGTPCDFSGEFDPSLDSLAAKKNLQLMVTSFNGGYIGYVTPGKYYDEDHYETQLMSWYGPGNGEYMKKNLEQLIIKVSTQ